MSWSKVAGLTAALVAFIFTAAVLAPPGNAPVAAAGAWLLSAALILVVPMDRR